MNPFDLSQQQSSQTTFGRNKRASYLTPEDVQSWLSSAAATTTTTTTITSGLDSSNLMFAANAFQQQQQQLFGPGGSSTGSNNEQMVSPEMYLKDLESTLSATNPLQQSSQGSSTSSLTNAFTPNLMLIPPTLGRRPSSTGLDFAVPLAIETLPRNPNANRPRSRSPRGVPGTFGSMEGVGVGGGMNSGGSDSENSSLGHGSPNSIQAPAALSPLLAMNAGFPNFLLSAPTSAPAFNGNLLVPSIPRGLGRRTSSSSASLGLSDMELSDNPSDEEGYLSAGSAYSVQNFTSPMIRNIRSPAVSPMLNNLEMQMMFLQGIPHINPTQMTLPIDQIAGLSDSDIDALLTQNQDFTDQTRVGGFSSAGNSPEIQMLAANVPNPAYFQGLDALNAATLAAAAAATSNQFSSSYPSQESTSIFNGVNLSSIQTQPSFNTTTQTETAYPSSSSTLSVLPPPTHFGALGRNMGRRPPQASTSPALDLPNIKIEPGIQHILDSVDPGEETDTESDEDDGGITGKKSSKQKRAAMFKCPVEDCGKMFTRPYNLKSHYRAHTGERPYQCPNCELKFCRRHDLKRHEKLHGGGKPHVCLACGKSFARGDALKRHLKSVDPSSLRSTCAQKARIIERASSLGLGKGADAMTN